MGHATKEWAQNVESTETLVLHNSREMLARLLNRRIRYLCTTYKMQNVSTSYPKYAMYVWFPVFLSRWCKMIGYDNLLCNVVWCYGTCLQALCSLFFFCLKAYYFFVYGHFAKCTNQDSDCVYAGTNLRHTRWYDTKMIPIWYGMYAMEGVDQWSLMCTSNVADNTQMASLDR